MGDICAINPAILLRILIAMGKKAVNIAYMVYQITSSSTTDEANLTYNEKGFGLSQITGSHFCTQFPFISRVFFLVWHAHEHYGEWPEMPTSPVTAEETYLREVVEKEVEKLLDESKDRFYHVEVAGMPKFPFER